MVYKHWICVLWASVLLLCLSIDAVPLNSQENEQFTDFNEQKLMDAVNGLLNAKRDVPDDEEQNMMIGEADQSSVDNGDVSDKEVKRSVNPIETIGDDEGKALGGDELVERDVDADKMAKRDTLAPNVDDEDAEEDDFADTMGKRDILAADDDAEDDDDVDSEFGRRDAEFSDDDLDLADDEAIEKRDVDDISNANGINFEASNAEHRVRREGEPASADKKSPRSPNDLNDFNLDNDAEDEDDADEKEKRDTGDGDDAAADAEDNMSFYRRALGLDEEDADAADDATEVDADNESRKRRSVPGDDAAADAEDNMSFYRRALGLDEEDADAADDATEVDADNESRKRRSVPDDENVEDVESDDDLEQYLSQYGRFIRSLGDEDADESDDDIYNKREAEEEVQSDDDDVADDDNVQSSRKRRSLADGEDVDSPKGERSLAVDEDESELAVDDADDADDDDLKLFRRSLDGMIDMDMDDDEDADADVDSDAGRERRDLFGDDDELALEDQVRQTRGSKADFATDDADDEDGLEQEGQLLRQTRGDVADNGLALDDQKQDRQTRGSEDTVNAEAIPVSNEEVSKNEEDIQHNNLQKRDHIVQSSVEEKQETPDEILPDCPRSPPATYPSHIVFDEQFDIKIIEDSDTPEVIIKT
ncbi:serine-aspartate repeat-containing protein I-like isoform X4 [Dreissena polymorpha]|uniref:serine-aspartate repeat-containing protein I-like isoform X3 n=1 Tax=Dreissena polymorpha TaxID=45954 RepID=UPI002264E268|nr:serine-aspartate repeat-containing protein I-like isoform X3 [Dreissena polymorpha]XP_052287007.1 serine-aspartate repeat-containing protein I-like isoform X4 [Dreissena polymorpha]